MDVIETLRFKTKEELRSMLVDRGMDYHHREKEDKLRARLVEVMGTTIVDEEPLVEEAVVGDVAPIEASQEKSLQEKQSEIMEAVKPFTSRGMVFSIFGEIWHARLGNKEDSGHISVPKAVIVRCCRNLF